MIYETIGIIVLGYLMGSIPFGLVIGKLRGGIDIREYGSGNIGFTNVLRTVGVREGIATLLGDIAKGAVPAVLGGVIAGSNTADVGGLTYDEQGAQAVGAIAAVVGHNWSIYLKFQGGKGVDTSLGGLLAMSPFVGLGCLVIGIAVIARSRYVSLGSIMGACCGVIILAPLVVLDYEVIEYLCYAVVVAVLIIIRHKDNIERLKAGTESKIGQKGEKK